MRSYTAHWPPERWQEYEPLLGYCRDNEVRLVACGAPLEVLSFILDFLGIFSRAYLNGLAETPTSKAVPNAVKTYQWRT